MDCNKNLVNNKLEQPQNIKILYNIQMMRVSWAYTLCAQTFRFQTLNERGGERDNLSSVCIILGRCQICVSLSFFRDYYAQ